jgi:hypothetical protein
MEYDATVAARGPRRWRRTPSRATSVGRRRGERRAARMRAADLPEVVVYGTATDALQMQVVVLMS